MSDNKWVLFVEDNEDDIELTLRALKANKIANEVRVARDGAEAIQQLFGKGSVAKGINTLPPILILLDLKLPKISGMEVLLRLRQEALTNRVPVVILTSSREQEDMAKGYDLGANSYIRKPVNFDQFQEAVRQLGMYWLCLNEPPPLKESTASHNKEAA
jgi:CheY-like chemotaxis protein